MAIVLKTAKRASSVPRSSIRKAVSAAYANTVANASVQQTATVTKKAVAGRRTPKTTSRKSAK